MLRVLSGRLRSFLTNQPIWKLGKFDQRDYAGAAREAIAQEIMVRMKTFNTVGHAKEVPNWGLAEMKAKY